MSEQASNGPQAIDELARRHGFSSDAVQSMLVALRRGNGSMAQFNHPEFSGAGQWMRGGMTMISDMFNQRLKSRVDALCSDLAPLIDGGQAPTADGGSWHQSQSRGAAGVPTGREPAGHGPDEASGRSIGPAGSASSLYVPAPPPMQRSDWWPGELRFPASTGSQNNVRYAYFPEQRRLAVEVHGRVTVYDTLDHRIGGVSQQQSADASVSFTSQHGLIDLARLPVVSG